MSIIYERKAIVAKSDQMRGVAKFVAPAGVFVNTKHRMFDKIWEKNYNVRKQRGFYMGTSLFF